MDSEFRVGPMSNRLTFMFALPRSRTQWWVEMVGKLPDVTAWHDPSKDCEHPSQLVHKIEHWLANNPGYLFVADTSALLFHEYLTTSMPDMTDIYVMRPIEDTIASVRRQTASDWSVLLRPMYNRLVAIRALAESTFFDFDDIDHDSLQLVMMMCSKHAWCTDSELKEMCDKLVDVPICDQITYPEKTKSLLSYREIG